MKSGNNPGEATSNTIGTVLFVAITIILLAIFTLIVMGFQMPELKIPEDQPVIFKIQIILSKKPDFDSRIVLKNIKDDSYENDLLRCEIFINDNPSICRIKTMNGHNFISTHHFGVQTMGGMGCSGIAWNPSEKIALDLSDHTIKKGDRVRIDIIWIPTDTIISSDEYMHN